MTTSRLTRLTLCVAVLALPQLSAAQGVQDTVVRLDAGLWRHEQKVTMAGRELGQGALEGVECLSAADTELTVGQYVEKFLANIGPDLRCTIDSLKGGSGRITADVSCVGDGTSTEMTMKYEYQRRSAAVTAQGWSTYGSNKIPFNVVASSRHIGDC